MKKLLIILILLLLAVPAIADPSVKLAWDHNDPLPEGYRVFQRTEGQPYDYTSPVWEGDQDVTTSIGLEPGTTYYWVVRAYDGNLQSADSVEVSYVTEQNLPPNAPQSPKIDSITYDNGGSVIINVYN